MSSMGKQQVTIDVDLALLQEVQAAVNKGSANSVSEWIGEAIAQKRATDQRLAALSELVAEYEAEHGFITDDEIAEQVKRDRDTAASSRGTALQCLLARRLRRHPRGLDR